jgi:hypothetical protein
VERVGPLGDDFRFEISQQHFFRELKFPSKPFLGTVKRESLELYTYVQRLQQKNAIAVILVALRGYVAIKF